MLPPTPYETDKLIRCKHCPRLRHHFRQLRQDHPAYWNRPVAASGPPGASLLIVGLAPGKHGANKTGLPFTGDASGDLLFLVLNQLQIEAKVRITNAVKCLPIDNKPSTRELKNCQKFLVPEINVHFGQTGPRVILVLGQVAHRAVIRALGLVQKRFPFKHGLSHELPVGQFLVCSYHCSRYNTQTGRLTERMFHSAVKLAAELAGLLQS